MIHTEKDQIQNSKSISLRKAAVLILAIQILLLILFGVFTQPWSEYVPKINSLTGQPNLDFSTGYSLFAGVAIMVFVGFGYLMTSVVGYGVAAVAFTLLIAVLGVQW